MPTTQGYWTEGKVVDGTNRGGGTFVPYTATNPAPTTTTPTSTSVATPTPAITPTRTPGLLETAQNDAAAATASRASARAQADSYAAQQRQARIDAINQTFAPRIAQQNVENQKNLSRVAALNVKSGVVGSGVDATKLNDQTTLGNKATQALEDQKATAINEAFGWADELARQRAENIYNDTKDTANANVEKYKAQQETAMNALKVFGAQDVTAEKLKTADPNTYATLRDVSGMSDAQIDAYLKVNAPEGTYNWSAATVNGSQMIVPGIDPRTKLPTITKIELGFTPQKKVQGVVKTDSGVLMYYDDGTHKVIGDGPKKDDWGSLSNADKTDAENWLRQQSDFTQADIDKLHNDRTFQALVLKQVAAEKAAVSNPFAQ